MGMLDLEIIPAEADIPDLMNRIERFSKDAMLEKMVYRNFSLMFEEIVINDLLTELRKKQADNPLRVHMEYSESDQDATLLLDWDGEVYNPVESGDELSRMIVTRLSKGVSYQHEGSNHLEIRI